MWGELGGKVSEEKAQAEGDPIFRKGGRRGATYRGRLWQGGQNVILRSNQVWKKKGSHGARKQGWGACANTEQGTKSLAIEGKVRAREGRAYSIKKRGNHCRREDKGEPKEKSTKFQGEKGAPSLLSTSYQGAGSWQRPRGNDPGRGERQKNKQFAPPRQTKRSFGEATSSKQKGESTVRGKKGTDALDLVGTGSAPAPGANASRGDALPCYSQREQGKDVLLILNRGRKKTLISNKDNGLGGTTKL